MKPQNKIDYYIKIMRSAGLIASEAPSILSLEVRVHKLDPKPYTISYQSLEHMPHGYMMNFIEKQLERQKYFLIKLQHKKEVANVPADPIDKFMQNVAAKSPPGNYWVPNAILKDVYAKKIEEDLKQLSKFDEIYAKLTAQQEKAAYPKQQSNQDFANIVAHHIPAIRTLQVMCPVVTDPGPCRCGCGSREKCYQDYNVSLWSLIQHLNDTHLWPREIIADYLDELHDSGVIDLTLTHPDPDRG